MAESQWRLNRTRAYETIAYAQLMGDADETNPEDAIVARMSQKVNNIFDLLRRYQAEKEAEAWLREQIAETGEHLRDHPLADTIATPIVYQPEYPPAPCESKSANTLPAGRPTQELPD